MENIKVFERIVKDLPEDHQVRLPEKIRWITNKREHTEFLKAIVLGAYLVLENEITITGYKDGDLLLPEFEAPYRMPDGHTATAIKNDHTGKMIVGKES